MKKFLVLFLSLSFTLPALAGPRDNRGDFRGDRRGHDFHRPTHRHTPSRPVIVHKHHSSDWIGPALIFGAITGAVIIANQDRPRETVIIREPPAPILKEKTIFEKISGGEARTLRVAQDKWNLACSEWTEELDNRFIDDYRTTCGSMTCVQGKTSYCYSTGNSTVTYR